MRERAGLRLLGVAGLILIGLVAGACTSGSDFREPTNPVSGVPWPDYELLRYDITDQRDVKLGTVDLEVRREGDVYLMRIVFLLDDTEDEVLVTVDAETLAPLAYERLAVDPEDRFEVEATYGVGADGQGVLESTVVRNGEREEAVVELSEFSFDTDSSAWLWRTIAFEQDYEVTYRSVNAVAQRTQLVRLRVVGRDQIRTPAGSFLAWQVQASPGPSDPQFIWFDVEAPHRLVRWVLEPRRYTLREILTEPPDEP